MSSAASTPEWNERIRGNGWIEVAVFGKSVRLWEQENPNHRSDHVPGLMNFAIQVFAGTHCRSITIIPHLNKWARAGMPIGVRSYRSSFYQIGFLAPKANTYRAAERAKWTIAATVSEIENCPGESTITTTGGIVPPKDDPFGGKPSE